MNRRTFLKHSTAAGVTLAAPGFLKQSISAPLNDQITLGFIGVGGMGTHNLKGFLNNPEVRIPAVCDVDRNHGRAAQNLVNEKYKNQDCALYIDFRDVIARPDIDAVVISTPDHWHTLPTLEAARHGKDIYLEKPLTLTVSEGRIISDTVRKYSRVLQTGSMQRSMLLFRRACELVRNGYIGEIQRVKVSLPGNNRTCPPTWQPQPAPESLDYEFWLGPAPYEPYTAQRCHYTFRFIRDYSGGQTTNWGAHYLDIAQWGLGMDHSGPVKIIGRGEFPETGLFNTATYIDFDMIYENGVKLTCRTGGQGTKFIGSEGSVFVNRGRLVTEPDSLCSVQIGPDDEHLYVSNDHHQNFIDCIRSRRNPITDAEIGHRSATLCHLGNIAMLLKAELHWDPVNERILNHDAANRMLSKPYREPWGKI